MFDALSPHQCNVVQAVYDWLVNADWFERTAANKEACARFLLLQYQEGMDEEILMALCYREAKERFGRST